jgi:hypothetical protein
VCSPRLARWGARGGEAGLPPHHVSEKNEVINALLRGGDRHADTVFRIRTVSMGRSSVLTPLARARRVCDRGNPIRIMIVKKKTQSRDGCVLKSLNYLFILGFVSRHRKYFALLCGAGRGGRPRNTHSRA